MLSPTYRRHTRIHKKKFEYTHKYTTSEATSRMRAPSGALVEKIFRIARRWISEVQRCFLIIWGNCHFVSIDTGWLPIPFVVDSHFLSRYRLVYFLFNKRAARCSPVRGWLCGQPRVWLCGQPYGQPQLQGQITCSKFFSHSSEWDKLNMSIP